MPVKKSVAKKSATPLKKKKEQKVKPVAKPAKATKTKAEKAKPEKEKAKKIKPEKQPAKKAKKTIAKTTVKTAVKSDAKPVAKKKQAAQPASAEPKASSKALQLKIESSLMIQGSKFLKNPFFFDMDKGSGSKQFLQQKTPDKPTACSRPKMTGTLDGKNLVELLSQQLEYENKTFFEGCEGQVCVKCNTNNVDSKYYVDRSLGYCTDCAMLLGLGQSKEGVFSDAQMELMRRSMEKSMESTKDMDEDDIESALDELDSMELEEALLAVEEEVEL
jgi:hypothetical protein